LARAGADEAFAAAGQAPQCPPALIRRPDRIEKAADEQSRERSRIQRSVLALAL
jgi:hypothetical protein